MWSESMPQLRGTARRFVSEVIPDTRTVVRTRPLERQQIHALRVQRIQATTTVEKSA